MTDEQRFRMVLQDALSVDTAAAMDRLTQDERAALMGPLAREYDSLVSALGVDRAAALVREEFASALAHHQYAQRDRHRRGLPGDAGAGWGAAQRSHAEAD